MGVKETFDNFSTIKTVAMLSFDVLKMLVQQIELVLTDLASVGQTAEDF